MGPWSLQPVSCYSLVHEISHRIGMGHPHSDSDFPVGLCEPPYVLGSIAEAVILGPKWKKSTIDDCSKL